ncbi:helix-turn-helix domain-containing protein [Streptomyces sp. NPDC005402]|uniref:helix-turn-helix domain-containing protein n=1 Tax=Streptomyces sp. NPDC005402 TaxID=3155338 RepID=UPI0033A326ED
MQHTQAFPASTASAPHGAESDRLVGSDRVPAVLRELARRPDGVTFDELKRAIGSPKPTVHRARATLRRPVRRSARTPAAADPLGDGFLRMAFAHHEGRPERVRVRPLLERASNVFPAPVASASTPDALRRRVGEVSLEGTVSVSGPMHLPPPRTLVDAVEEIRDALGPLKEPLR